MAEAKMEVSAASSWAVTKTQSLDLSGTWSFQLDPDKVGEPERWFEQSLGEEIRLPGSTDEQGFGTKATRPELKSLYQQYINSPEYLKNASYGWALRGFTHLVGNAFIPLGQLSAQRSLYQRIHQQRKPHHHQQRHDTLWLLQKQTGSEKHGIFEKAKPTLHRCRLSFGG